MDKKYQQTGGLTAAQAERLAIIAEEAGEVVQAVTKILRHGFDSCHPNGGPDNRSQLETELGNLAAATRMSIDADDISPVAINAAAKDKEVSVRQYLHHQVEPKRKAKGLYPGFPPPKYRDAIARAKAHDGHR